MKFFSLLILALSVAAALPASDPESLKFFENNIRPLLSENCYECHGTDKVKGGLRLDHIDTIKNGGDSGPAIVEGKPSESLLIEAVHRLDEDFAMPPKKELSSASIQLLEKWIEMGAPWPADETAKSGKVDQNGFTEEDYQWWAIQPVKDPTIPKVKSDWVKNEIDSFILQKLNEAKLSPAPEASREELIRRASFDLHGLPPTPELVTSFVNDKRPDAWDLAVDGLLASPRYGERWAQHWLDVVRYAESDGYRADDFRPDTYKYRDYVIRSLNQDKPYDLFVKEQLAADEFAADDPDTLVATAFLRLGIYEWNQRNARMQWDLIMTEMTNVTGEAFLGLGIGCAQCHDHKFDPILQKDHFALQAFLNTTWWPEKAPMVTPEEQSAYDRKLTEWKAATVEIQEKLDALQKSKIEGARLSTAKQFPDDVQKIYHKAADARSAYEEQLAQLVQRQVDKSWRGINWEKTFEKKEKELETYRKLSAELAKFDHLKPEALPTGFISTDVHPDPASTFFDKRGTKEEVEPAFLTLLGQPAPKITPGKSTTGRRLALAEWIANEDNPFSTRVIVNRLWQRHFGKGIVQTPNDFGRLGEEPTHPELLDWLTSRFLENGWKLKPLHRLIMTSAAYQQTARREPTSVEDLADPGNKLIWRFPPQRLQAEQVRDAMLAASGEMKPRDEGGASVDGNSPYRSVFVKKRRNTPDAMIGGFDSPSGFNSSASRIATTTPNQSLMLVNGDWSMARAKAFAKQLLAGKGAISAEQIAKGYLIAYGRNASQSEIDGALAFIESQTATVGSAPIAPAKYPGETGVRDIKQKFGFAGREKYQLGEKSLWLQPDSKFGRLDFTSYNLPDEEFTIEAIADIDAVHPNASVNTLAGRWNGSYQSTGWAFGVTSAKSRYQPRNFILQLTGPDFQGNIIYEVVASDLRFPQQKPAYFAATISAKPDSKDATKGSATFYLKELSDPKAELQKVTVPHQIVGGLKAKDVRSLIGSRDEKGHTWDGQLARLVISEGVLTEEQLLINNGTGKRVLDFNFGKGTSEKDAPEPGTAWVGKDTGSAPESANTQLLAAVTDFCQALLSSNEFLYLH